jgi:Rad3-related DNA helicase
MTVDFNEVMLNFPGSPREEQKKVIKKICDIFSSGKKYAIVNVPTGVGKSHIAATLCKATHDTDPYIREELLSCRAFITENESDFAYKASSTAPAGGAVLTTTKMLQDQYENLFLEMTSLKGMSNYACNVDSNFSIDIAPCKTTPSLKTKCLTNGTCSYYMLRGKALASQFSVFNYNVYLNLKPHLRYKELLICDEATEIEELLVSKHTCNIPYSVLEAENVPFKKLKTEDKHTAYAWLGELSVSLSRIIKDLSEIVNLKKNKKNAIIASDVKRLSRLRNLFESVSSVIQTWSDSDYIVEWDLQSVTFTPFNVDKLSHHIFDFAEKVVLMSATIIDHRDYAQSLGISPNDYEYFEVESPFDPEASPIKCLSKYPLSFNTMKSMLPKVIDIATDICESHAKEKGVIHTHTFQISEAFQRKVQKEQRFLFRSHGTSNEQIIDIHSSSLLPTVVVSPSMSFGVSFDDDSGRFQIIMKAPYMPLSSKRIKMIFDKFPQRYQNKMLVNLVQMCGRCTRNKDDHSITYILDATAVKAILREKDKLPKYFLSRII